MSEKKSREYWESAPKEELAEEFKKCKNDPCHFISNHIYIVHQMRGLIPFSLYPFQVKIIEALQKNRFNIMRKFRQAGITTIACAYSLWVIIFKKNKVVPILSIGDTESTETLERIKLMYDELPSFLRPKEIKRNEHILHLSTGSKVVSRPSKKTSGRSLSGYLLIIDEAAFIDKIEDIWAAVYPIISTGGRVFVISTVNGVGNWYYNTYALAKDGVNEFNVIDIHWKEHPEYYYTKEYEWLYTELQAIEPTYDVQRWEDITRKNIGPRRWLQEYEAQFLGTGSTYLDGSIITELFATVDNNFFIKYNNRMRVWKDPHPSHEYLISVDVAIGRELDYSAFHIIDIYSGEQVAEFYSNKTPINEFAEIIVTEAKLYNEAYVFPERNTIGLNLIDRLVDLLEYDNVWCDEKGQFGIQVTLKNKETLLANMEEAIRKGEIRINSKRTVEEIGTFIINDTGKPEADVGNHDDLVSSLALAVFGLRFIRTTTPIEFATNHITSESMPLHFSSTRKTLEDHKWLLG